MNTQAAPSQQTFRLSPDCRVIQSSLRKNTGWQPVPRRGPFDPVDSCPTAF